MTVRVRFAPSPTGFLHIGGARTALFNWLFAQQHQGQFILRIEDTDTQRSTQEFTDAILHAMDWLGMSWDEGPFHQMERIEIYRAHVEQLLAAGKAYRCYCTPDALDAMRKKASAEGRKPTYDRTCRVRASDDTTRPHCIRFAARIDGTTIVRDLVHGEIPFDNKELDDLVILRSDGTPTYNFTVVVDDVTMRMTHVIRGDDHLNNTPRQMLLYEAFSYPTPIFAHIPMILGADKQRLSKRHGATSVNAYQDAGYLPHALLNYLARLGWSHGDQELFTLDEMVHAFSFDHVHKSAAIFSPDKLQWVNAEHLKKYSNDALYELTLPFLQKLALATDDRAYGVAAVASERERAKTLQELAEVSAFYFRSDITYDTKSAAQWLNDDGKSILTEIRTALQAIDDWNEPVLKAALEAIRTARGVKFVNLAQPLRVAFTGTTVSPGIYEVLLILGKARTLTRIERALAG